MFWKYTFEGIKSHHRHAKTTLWKLPRLGIGKILPAFAHRVILTQRLQTNPCRLASMAAPQLRNPWNLRNSFLRIALLVTDDGIPA